MLTKKTEKKQEKKEKKSENMEEEDFFAQYRARHRHIKELQGYSHVANAGSWQKLLEAQQQVLVECAAHQGNVSELTDLSSLYMIPEGFIKCCGPCERVLKASRQNFRKDARLKSGFRAKCKQCSSVKKNKKRRKEDEEEEEEESFVLECDGFQVFRNAFVIEDDIVELLKQYSDSKWTETLFNNQSVDDERNDKRRRQIFFHVIESRDRRLADFRSRIQLTKS